MNTRATKIRLTNILFISQSMVVGSQIAIFTLLAILGAQICGRESLAGLPSTMLTFAKALSALPLGILMGRVGRRLGLTLSFAIATFGAILSIYAIIDSIFWLFLLGTALLGVGRAGGDLSRFAAGDMFPEGERAQMIGRIVFAGTVGSIVGPFLIVPGEWVAQFLNVTPDIAPWLIGIVFYGLATALTFFALNPDPLTLAEVPASPTEALPTQNRTTRQLFAIPNIQLALVAMLISQTVMVAIMVMTPLHMEHHNHARSAISFVITAHTLGMYGFSSLTGYLIKRFGIIITMVMGGVVMLISTAITPIAPTLPILTAGLFLLGLGWNMGYIAGSTLLSNTLRGIERNRMQGVADLIVGLASGLGSLGAGPVFGIGGFWTLSLLGGVISLIFMYLIYILDNHSKQAETTTALVS